MPPYDDLIASMPEHRRAGVERGLAPFVADGDALAIALTLVDGLNPEQIEVVLHPLDGEAMLVLGGAGSGKTAMLVRRIVYLLMAGVPIGAVFAVTFTRRAADEMMTRTRDLLEALTRDARAPYDAWLRETAAALDGAWITTFHAACLRILRERPDGGASNLERLGLAPYSRILAERERVALVAGLSREIEPSADPERVASAISRAKNSSEESDGGRPSAHEDEIAARILPTYLRRLEAMGALDFDDLIFRVNELFGREQEIARTYAERFRSLLIDEYQDTNLAQFRLSIALTRIHGSVTAVGDDDQSIYSWRGADMDSIDRFLREHPGCRTVKLVRNYRSDAAILAAANSIWEDKPAALRKYLVRARGGADRGERLTVHEAGEGASECAWIASELARCGDRGESLAEIAVLVRVQKLIPPLAAALDQVAIPWVQSGSMSSLARPDIVATVAAMTVVALLARRVAEPARFHAGDRESLRFELRTALGHPFFNCDPAAASEIDLAGAADELLLDPVVRGRAGAILHHRAGYALDFIAALGREALVSGGVWEPSSMLAWMRGRFGAAANSVREWEKIEEQALLSDRLRAPDGVERILAFAEEIYARTGSRPDQGDRPPEDKEEVGAVRLMTIHAAKGLEFDSIFLPACEEGILPLVRDGGDAGREERLSEEKRLFYVAVTRARHKLVVTWARRRELAGYSRDRRPSRFLDLLPAALTVRKRMKGA